MNLGIIGVGKLGLAYALVFENRGFHVYASSYNQEYVENLQRRHTDSVEPGIAPWLRRAVNIDFTIDNHEVIRNCDMIYVMVATPSTTLGDYDISALQQVVDDFRNHPEPVSGKILIVGSTVNPGDCARMQEQLTDLGVDVVYCPTFAAQGTVMNDVMNPIGILLGSADQDVAQRCSDMFARISPPNTLTVNVDPTTAEILKLSSNCYSTLRISFFNQVGQMLIHSGMQHDLEQANVYLNAIDRRKGNLKFGFGFGGPCYPRDNRAFGVFAERVGCEYSFGPVIDDFNQAHSTFLANWFEQQNVHAHAYYFDYITYKPGVSIMEESQQFNVCRFLLDRGAKVYIKPTEFLPQEVRQDLKHRYGDQVDFADIEQLQQDGVEFYHINI